jgi:hypothetical protein
LYVLSLQLIWYYYRPVLLAIYYLAAAIFLALATWRYYSSAARSRLWITVVAAALLIGMIPYEMRLPLVAGLFAPGEIEMEDLSDATRKWPTVFRALFEVALYPVIHFVLQCATAMAARRSRI